MTTQGPQDRTLEELLATPPVLADRGFSARTLERIARQQRLRRLIFGVSAICWLGVAGMASRGAEAPLVRHAAAVSDWLLGHVGALFQGERLPELVAALVAPSSLPLLAIAILATYAVVSMQAAEF